MPGPNLLVSNQGPLGAGAATVHELQGGRFSRQIGGAHADMRQSPLAVSGQFMLNTIVWFKGKLYWCGATVRTNTTVRVKVHNPATDTWSDVYTAGINPRQVGFLIVVNSGSESYLVFGSQLSGVIHYVRTTDGVTWGLLSGSPAFTVFTHRPGNAIAHGGLVFLHLPGPANNSGNRQTYDPVSGSIGSFSPSAVSSYTQVGSFFKFDGRLFHIAGHEPVSAPTVADLTEFAFGSWSVRSFGTGYSGTQMFLGGIGGTTYNAKCAAVVIDDDTVLVFGTGNDGGGTVFKAYELTLSAGSGSSLAVADVSATYDPGGLGGDVNNYFINNIGKGPDGFWYLAFANDDSLTGLGLVRVVKGSPWADAGSMGASTGYAVSLASLNGGERRDSRGFLPLVKPSPLSSDAGPTGLLQNFRVDGDHLIALHGAVTGGPFVDGEAVTWTGGSGIVLNVGVAELHIHTIVGAIPDGLLMTGGTSGATATCSTSSGNGQAHTVRLLFHKDANGTGLGAPSPIAPSGYGTLIAGSGVNCVVSKGTGPGGSDEVITDADGSGQVKTFEWDFLTDGIFAFVADNVKLQASRV